MNSASSFILFGAGYTIQNTLGHMKVRSAALVVCGSSEKVSVKKFFVLFARVFVFFAILSIDYVNTRAEYSRNK